MAAAAKRRRHTAESLEADRSSLTQLRSRLPFISQSALATILGIARTETLPTISTRRGIRSSRDLSSSMITPYGELHQQLVDETTGTKFEIQHPCCMLYQTCKISAAFAALMSQVRDSSPAAPLSLVFYCDEITPGNQLSYKNKRKTWGFYWSILELGNVALSFEDIRRHSHIYTHTYI